MSLPKRDPARSTSNLPGLLGELFGQMRLKGFNSAGVSTNILIEDDGTPRSQLLLWNYAGAAQIRAAGEPTTGEAHVLLHGKDAGGAVDELRTNASQELIVDIDASSTRKVLGQSAPNATTETVLYIVPASTEVKISMFSVANRGSSALTFRMGLSVGGGALGNADYIYYNLSIPVGNAFIHAAPIFLATTDEVRIFASSGDASFTVTGEEFA